MAHYADPQTSFMLCAIELARRASMLEKTGGPFGAVIVKDNTIIAQGYNQVLKQNDPTWHAEMHAIRQACATLQSPFLKDCILYTSAEPCPMCMSAAYWAQLKRIYFASTVADAKQYGNFQDTDIYSELVKQPQERAIPTIPFMRESAVALWQEFAALPDRAHY